MISHLGLFQLKLHQFVDLQNLAKRDEEAVLLDFAVAQDDFAMTRRLGVRGFPTLFVEVDGRIGQLSSGYVTAEQVTSALRSVAA